MARRLGGLLCLLVAVSVGWWAATAAAVPRDALTTPAPAATDADAPVAIDQHALVDPGAGSPTLPDYRPAPGGGATLRRGPDRATEQQLARGNAAMQEPQDKAREAQASCQASPPPTSRLLALGGSVGSEPPKSWTVWALVACVAAAGIATAAFGVRKRAARDDKGPLEHIATIVAIAAGVAALAGQFVPGVGAHDAPPPEATMQVRDVNARITRGDFATALGVRRPSSDVDGREIGNVVWLAIHLQGFRGRTLTLQWGSYDHDDGERFVPGTERSTPLRVTRDGDEQTLFQPIWVGYPQDEVFSVSFRLLDRGQVREIASTGRMRGARYRYACPVQA
jgi:hypothetical protein